MVFNMEKKYNSNSFKSKIFKSLIKLSNFKKNTSSTFNSERYMKICQKKKLKKSIFKNMSKKIYKNQIIYSYNEESSKCILIYIHGGSYVDKPLKIQLEFMKKVAKMINAELIVPIYKTLPNGNYKIFFEEIIDLYKSLLKRNKKMYLIGDSAGGGAVLSFNMLLVKEGINKIEATILLSPWLDMTLENPEILDKEKKDVVCSIEGNRFFGEKWADDICTKDFRVSPIYGDMTGLNNLFFSCGGNEICQPDCLKLSQLLQKAKINYKFIEFEKQFHNFELYPIKESKILIDEIEQFILEGK